MRIDVFPTIFAGSSRGPFWLAGLFLVDGAPDFGPNPKELFIRPYFRNVRDSFGIPEYIDKYNILLSKLPRIKVLNQSNLVEIEYLSNVCMDEYFEGYRAYLGNQRQKVEAEHGPQPPARPYDAELLRRFCVEMLEIFPTFRKRMAKVEGFDFDRFLAWAELRFKDLPSSDESLKKYADDWLARPKEAHQPLGWDDLLIDWSKFHPRAREILDDLFYWDCVYEYAPHGNDEGADVLEHFQRWRKRSRTGDSRKFFEHLMRDWGVDLKMSRIALDDTYPSSIIGLAFAHLKIDAACPAWVREDALKVLRNQRNEVNTSEAAVELASYLDMMIRKLEETSA